MRDPLPLPSRAPDCGTRGDAAPVARRRRRLSAAAAAALAGAALAPGLGTLPAAAAPSTCGTAQFSAAAAADLVRLDLLDLGPVGVPVGPITKVRLVPTKAGTNGGAESRSSAEARYLIAKLLGVTVPAGPLDARAYQESPPVTAAGETVQAPRIDLGALSAGPGTLTAHTTWPAAPRCTPVAGPTATSQSVALDATVLPAEANAALVRLPGKTSSSSLTGLVSKGGKLHPLATATASAAEIRLLENTDGQVIAKVVSEPELTVTAAGSKAESTVKYTSPVLDLTLPGGRKQRLDNANRQVEIPLPAGPADPAALKAAGTANPLGQLLGRLPALGHITSTASAVQGESTNATTVGTVRDLPGAGKPAVPGLEALPGANTVPGLSDLPVVGAVTGALTGTPSTADTAEEKAAKKPAGKAQAASGPQAVIRLSLGGLTQKITDERVQAKAATLRLQVVVKNAAGNGSGTGDGYGGTGGGTGGEQTILDLGVGVLDASAELPPGGGGSSGGGGGESASPSPAPGGGTGGGGSLPVTGPGVAFIVGGAVAFLGAGRLLMILARRRTIG
jgi:hypothetical protein